MFLQPLRLLGEETVVDDVRSVDQPRIGHLEVSKIAAIIGSDIEAHLRQHVERPVHEIAPNPLAQRSLADVIAQ